MMRGAEKWQGMRWDSCVRFRAAGTTSKATATAKDYCSRVAALSGQTPGGQRGKRFSAEENQILERKTTA
jgi:hypothetical protein